MTHRLHNVVYARLEAIANAEKITRKELGELSRELLTYVPDTHDIDIVNRLIGVLTPVNRRAAIAYFKHFLPWQVEHEADGQTFSRFGKMLQGEKKVKRRMDSIAEWLKDEANNIWKWSDDNLDVEVKQKDFYALVSKQIQKALEGDEKSDTPALTRDQLVAAIFAGGVTIDDMLYGIEAREQAMKEAEDRDTQSAIEGARDEPAKEAA